MDCDRLLTKKISNSLIIVFSEGEVNANINNVQWNYSYAFTTNPKVVCSTTVSTAYRIGNVSSTGANISLSQTPAGKWYYRAIAIGY